MSNVSEHYPWANDHELVAALRDPTHPQHMAAWLFWRRQIPPILQAAGLFAIHDGVYDVDDLSQQVLEELIQALPTFRFASRVSTWMYTVTVRTGKRLLRHHSAAKRRAFQVALDHPDAQHAAVAHDSTITGAEHAALTTLVDQILTAKHSRRLAIIFRLWAVHDWRLADIGQRLGVSAPRVSALIQTACDILRQHPALEDWQPADAAPHEILIRRRNTTTADSSPIERNDDHG